MKRIMITLSLLLAMMAMGTGLKAQEVTITLKPGWNWISYPNAEAMGIKAALGDFEPLSGDVIKSKENGQATWNNVLWLGALKNLVPGQGYMYYSSRTATTSFVFAKPVSSLVTTLEPTDITAVGAVVGSTVTIGQGNHIFARGVCWGAEPNPTIDGDHIAGDAVTGEQSFPLDGLTPGVTYYVRAYVVTDYGLAYGEEMSFTALGGIPEVTTAGVTDVLGDGATCGGTVTNDGGLTITARGVCWSEASDPTILDSHTTDGTGAGEFVSVLTNLEPNTTYYVRAYATNSYMTVYGSQESFTTQNGIPSLTTATVTDILTDGATCGGTVTNDGGLTITARGVCWSTSRNPTILDSHTSDGTGTGGFVSTLTGLSPSTTYYVRAYATNSYVTVYGSQRSFTTATDHDYVDLGLPSGTLWATCNVGAENPEDYGDYFAWGETQPKETYNWTTYQYCNGSSNTLTKYCDNSSYGYNGFTDNLTTLLPEDDAATANWGEGWRMPTQAEFQELLDNTTVTWTQQNGVNGRLFTADNGNSLFLPAAGSRYDSYLFDAGSLGDYWSSSLYTGSPDYAWYLYFYSDYYLMDNNDRYCGQSVRPVRSGQN